MEASGRWPSESPAYTFALAGPSSSSVTGMPSANERGEWPIRCLVDDSAVSYHQTKSDRAHGKK